MFVCWVSARHGGTVERNSMRSRCGLATNPGVPGWERVQGRAACACEQEVGEGLYGAAVDTQTVSRLKLRGEVAMVVDDQRDGGRTILVQPGPCSGRR